MNDQNINTYDMGTRVKFCREKRQMSQMDLAKKIGVSQGTIAHIESGRNQSTKYIVDLAKALKVSAEWLSEGKGKLMDDWPFPNVSQSDYLALSDSTKQEIEQFVLFKILNNKQFK